MVRFSLDYNIIPSFHSCQTFDIEQRSFYGDESLSLPHSSRGPIPINTDHDRTVLSPAFAERARLLTEVSLAGVRRTCFLGDRPGGGKWGYGDTGNKADNDLLDYITVQGGIHARGSTGTAKRRFLLWGSAAQMPDSYANRGLKIFTT